MTNELLAQGAEVSPPLSGRIYRRTRFACGALIHHQRVTIDVAQYETMLRSAPLPQIEGDAKEQVRALLSFYLTRIDAVSYTILE